MEANHKIWEQSHYIADGHILPELLRPTYTTTLQRVTNTGIYRHYLCILKNQSGPTIIINKDDWQKQLIGYAEKNLKKLYSQEDIMKEMKTVLLFCMISVLLTLIISGCSDNTFGSSDDAEAAQSAPPTAYIPLEQGLRVSYSVVQPETKFFDLEVTIPSRIAGHNGFKIRSVDRLTGATNSFYRYASGNAIYESTSLSDPGYKILEGPFATGHGWNRYDGAVTNDDYDYGNGDNGNDIGDIKNDLGNLFGNSNPGDNYGYMSIVGFEDVVALDGQTYGSCLKVAWQSSETTTNYYWYATGIGMVKFQYGFNYLAASDNSTIGIMTNYQTVAY